MNKFIHKISWWAKDGFDQFGNPGWSAPVVIDARWEDRNTFFADEAGKQATSNAVVIVDRKVEIGDFLYFGENTNPTPVDGAKEVRSSQAIYNVQGDKVDYQAIL